MEQTQRYNLPILLRFDGLNIRGMAEANLAKTVRQFFNALSDFMEVEPATAEVLGEIADYKSVEGNIQKLSKLQNTLESISCGQLITDIDELIEALKQSDYGCAASYSKQISEKMTKLTERIALANKLEESNKQDVGKLTLKEALEQLDHEEATRKLKILAVDDVAAMLLTITSSLKSDYTVYTMSKPEMVEDFLKIYTPELFLLDYHMPEVNGFDLVPIIRSFDEHKETPIIFVTSMGTVDHLTVAVGLGACDFVVKPINPDVLREKIEKHIVRRNFYK